MPNDIPICDVCTKREATSIEDGIYRCEECERAHLALDAKEQAVARAQASDHIAIIDAA
jgi:ribosomal protein L37AE/L43A